MATILRAIQSKNLSQVQSSVQSGEDPLKFNDQLNHSPFTFSIALGEINIISYFLSLPSVQEYNKKKSYPESEAPPILIAVSHSKPDTASLLLKAGANPCISIPSKNGVFPLYLASQKNESSIVSLLLNHGADPNQTTLDGRTATYTAAYFGHSEVIKSLSEGPQVLKADYTTAEDKMTPLWMASFQGHIQCIQYLIKLGGADVNKVSTNSLVPLAAAIQRNKLDAISKLLELGANPYHSWESNGMSYNCINFCAVDENWNAMNLLLTSLKSYPVAIILYVLALNRSEILPILTSKVNIFKPYGNKKMSVLSRVLVSQQQEMIDVIFSDLQSLVKELKDSDTNSSSNEYDTFDINTPSVDGHTVLSIAVGTNQQKFIPILLSLGANPNTADNIGGTPLILACQLGNLSIVKSLVGAGADVNKVSKDGISPLALAVQQKHKDVVVYLLSLEQIDPNVAESSNGIFPLYFAALAASLDISKALMKHPKINMYQKTNSGGNILHAAVRSQNNELVEMIASLHPTVFSTLTSTPSNS